MSVFKLNIFANSLTFFFLAIVSDEIYTKNVSVCYYKNWSQYYKGIAKFLPEHIDPTLCSVINYSFNRRDMHTYTMVGRQKNDEDMINRLLALKKQNPFLKVQASMGGWSHEKFPRFVNMVKFQQRRKIFINSVIDYLTTHKLDGINIDWEYPGVYTRDEPSKYPTERKKDKRRFIYLLQEMRDAFDYVANKTGKRFMLTLAVGQSRTKIDKGYEVPKISKLVDWIDVMAYNLRGHWRNYTGCPTLMKGEIPTVPDGVDAWIEGGMDPNKINLGLASYGKSFKLKDRSVRDVGAPTIGKGAVGNHTQTHGVLAYYEICAVSWKHKTSWRDSSCGAPYASDNDDDMWVAYDDPASIKHKVEAIVNRRGLNGISIWALDMDDFSGTACNENTYPLLRAAVDTMKKGNAFGNNDIS